MSTILEKIVNHKRKEVAARKTKVTIEDFQLESYFEVPTLSLKKHLQDPTLTGIIAEFKRRSPSKGIINADADVIKTTTGYSNAKASGLSILTDEHFFGGSDDNIRIARPYNLIPILRKEFIVDEYQIYEAKAIGADVILLIAECLSKEEIYQFAKTAKSVDLEVLMEIHSENQLDKCNEYLDIIGVNNRNLKDFTVSIETSAQLFDKIPNEFVKISESGISKPESIVYLKQVGFQGFLIGEYFMLAEEPEKRMAEFAENIKLLELK